MEIFNIQSRGTCFCMPLSGHLCDSPNILWASGNLGNFKGRPKSDLANSAKNEKRKKSLLFVYSQASLNWHHKIQNVSIQKTSGPIEMIFRESIKYLSIKKGFEKKKLRFNFEILFCLIFIREIMAQKSKKRSKSADKNSS